MDTYWLLTSFSVLIKQDCIVLNFVSFATFVWWIHLDYEDVDLPAIKIRLDVVVIVFHQSLEEVKCFLDRYPWKVRRRC